ncbi:unnamed protein product [Merluccius merluccius]
MYRKECPAGRKWDERRVTCVPSGRQTERRPLGRPPRTTPPPAPIVMSHAVAGPWRTPVLGPWTEPTASPFLWAAVAVVATGSILALVLWTLIYRRHRNHSNGLPPPTLEPMDKTDPLAGVHKSPALVVHPAESIQRDQEPPCPHLDGGTHSTDSRHVTDSHPCCVGGLKPGVTWVGEAGATGRKHRIPLPATELGDTTLVTAKTCRDQ